MNALLRALRTAFPAGEQRRPSSSVDRQARRAALALSGALPADTLLYLLLPMYASDFGVTLPEAGLLLAANRLVRIVGYRYVQAFYARRGAATTCTLAVVGSALCSLGYATLSGFWALLPFRLLWGLSFAGLNLAAQITSTAEPAGAARRSGRSRGYVALGSALALPIGAVLTDQSGPRLIFFTLTAAALLPLLVTPRLPSTPHPAANEVRRFRLPNNLDIWSFLEGFTLDGLFVVGLSYMGKDLMPTGAVIVAGTVSALRYVAEIFLSPVGGHVAERFGPVRALIALSLLTCLALTGFGAGWLWTCAAAIVVLRALQLPLLPPIVALRTPGPDRLSALASRAVWRDIGAGTGPIIAGLLLPFVPSLWIYAISAACLAVSAMACRHAPARSPETEISSPNDC